MKKVLLIILLVNININFAQSNLSIGESKYTIDIFTGTNLLEGVNATFGNEGDGGKVRVKYVAKFGFRPITVIGHQNLSSVFSFGLQTDYNQFKLPEDANDAKRWKSLSLSFGPEYKIIRKGPFFIQLYGRIGTSFIQVPDSKYFYSGTRVITDEFEDSNVTSLEGKLGSIFSYEISPGLRIMSNFELSSNLNNPIKYKHRDITKAINRGELNEELANSLPFEDAQIKISFISLNVGLSFNIFNKQKPDNSLDGSLGRQMNMSDNDGETNNNIPPPLQATDWNSTRSNKTSKTTRVGNPNGNDDEETLPAKGRGKAKRECLKEGGTFWESSNGSYFCMNNLELSKVIPPSNIPHSTKRNGKRKCWKEGGTWVTNSQGSFCWNPTKNKGRPKEVIKKKESVK